MCNFQKSLQLMVLALITKNIYSFNIPPIGGNVATGTSPRTLTVTYSVSVDENSASNLTEEKVDEKESKVERFKENIKQVKSDVKPPKKTENKNKKNGPFTPVVKTVRIVIGDDKFKKLKLKGIGMHSDVIKGFVDTSDSKFGQFVLKQLFAAADKDKNGTIERDELEAALKRLGFEFLKDGQMKGIFQRADADKNGGIDLEEFMKSAPKVLQQNLVKLAKNNGGDLGLLS